MKIASSDLSDLILSCLKDFHKRRLERLNTLRLKQVLRRKNPYLFKAVGTQSAPEIVGSLLSAYISSSDEGIFGDAFFEPIAKAVSGGVVSPNEGVDIAIETKTKYLAIAVKSGPNQYNASQKKRQNDEFNALRSRLMKLKKQFDALLGHCYGQLSTEPSKSRIYRDRSGQEFWYEITGDKNFYLKLIELMNDDVINTHKHDYKDAWEQAVNRYLREFTNDFCLESGAINWEKLVQFNSGSKSIKAAVSKKKR